MNYSYQDLKQGHRLRQQSEENPSTFGTNEGALTREESPSFGTSRMAGAVGARALQLMNDPQEAKRTEGWMQQFGLSNPGYDFNQARMMMENPQPPADQESAPQEQK